MHGLSLRLANPLPLLPRAGCPDINLIVFNAGNYLVKTESILTESGLNLAAAKVFYFKSK